MVVLAEAEMEVGEELFCDGGKTVIVELELLVDVVEYVAGVV